MCPHLFLDIEITATPNRLCILMSSNPEWGSSSWNWRHKTSTSASPRTFMHYPCIRTWTTRPVSWCCLSHGLTPTCKGRLLALETIRVCLVDVMLTSRCWKSLRHGHQAHTLLVQVWIGRRWLTCDKCAWYPSTSQSCSMMQNMEFRVYHYSHDKQGLVSFTRGQHLHSE